MGIGDIIGGAVGRYGERSWEAAERQRKLEDIGRHANFNALLGHLTTNYENMLPEEHEAVIGKLETIYPGTTKGMLGPLVGGVRSISQIMPAVQSAPTSTPRTSMDQLPTPAETVPSPIAYSPVPAHTIRTPAQTPGQVVSQRRTDQEETVRRQRLHQIEISDLPPEYKEMAKTQLYWPQATSYEVASMRTQAQSQRDAARMQQREDLAGKVVQYRVPGQTPGASEVRSYRVVGGRLYDQNDVEVQLPTNAVPVREGYVTTTDDSGNVNVINPQAAVGPGNYRATIEGAGRKTQPRSSGGASKSREFRDVMALRKDFESHPITKQADETAKQVRMATTAMNSKSPNFVAIDQVLINVFNKMVDTQSVVKEGEYARTIENTPLLNRIKGKAAAVLTGGAGLTAEERKAVYDLSKQFAIDSQGSYEARANEFKRMATEQGWNPSDVVVPRAQSVGPVNPAEAKQQLIDYLKQKKSNMQQPPGRR